jgi:hypothetical protein
MDEKLWMKRYVILFFSMDENKWMKRYVILIFSMDENSHSMFMHP